MNKLSLCTLSAIGAVAAVAPASGLAKTPAHHAAPKVKPVPAAVKDCAADGDLDKVYSPGALTLALKRMPTDVGEYTQCPDVLRAARAAVPVLPVTKKHATRVARLRARCAGAAYSVTIAVKGTTVGTATVPACKKGRTKLVRVPVTSTGFVKARHHALATVVEKPGAETLQFVVRLSGHKIFG
jgi:hypothetical protein